MLRSIVISIFLLGSSGSFAAIHCACEMGQDKNEKFFYKVGCDMWLQAKKCDTKKVINRQPGQLLSQWLPAPKAGDVYELGYVGHWYNSPETIRYVERHLVPIAKKRGVDVRFDNTGCKPMEDPEAVQDYLRTVDIPVQSQILVKGSQADTIGMWDQFFIRHADFYSHASTEWSNPRFLSCQAHEGKICSAAHQAGEKGRCYDKKIKRLVWLYCQKPGGKKHAYEWQRR